MWKCCACVIRRVLIAIPHRSANSLPSLLTSYVKLVKVEISSKSKPWSVLFIDLCDHWPVIRKEKNSTVRDRERFRGICYRLSWFVQRYMDKRYEWLKYLIEMHLSCYTRNLGYSSLIWVVRLVCKKIESAHRSTLIEIKLLSYDLS